MNVLTLAQLILCLHSQVAPHGEPLSEIAILIQHLSVDSGDFFLLAHVLGLLESTKPFELDVLHGQVRVNYFDFLTLVGRLHARRLEGLRWDHECRRGF